MCLSEYVAYLGRNALDGPPCGRVSAYEYFAYVFEIEYLVVSYVSKFYGDVTHGHVFSLVAPISDLSLHI